MKLKTVAGLALFSVLGVAVLTVGQPRAGEAIHDEPLVAIDCDLASTADDEQRLIGRLLESADKAKRLAGLTVDYPLNESIFPPDLIAPTFLWHDSGDANRWLVEASFAEGPERIRILVQGLPPAEGEIDPLAISGTNEVYKPTPYQASAKSWKPQPAVWELIKRLSRERPAVLTFYGYRKGEPARALSSGSVKLTTSADPVGAPIFYRDVPLSPAASSKEIMPLPKGALPLIKWRLRNVSLPESRVMLSDMPTCGNCHSFSADGKTFGMDIDGRTGDKGAYALAAIEKELVIDEDDIISWNSFKNKPQGVKTLGFLSRVSPDGRYAVSTLNEAIYVRNFQDFGFGQVFYPTRGILAYYDRETEEMLALPGADNPEFVHNGGVWTPDGKSLVYARGPAKDPFPEDRPLAMYAGDPNELPMRYDLYRIPFNAGRGGVSEPIRGASHNGMSNTFPKVSPDGKWIVFVKCKNGMLMRPDSELWIVPASGGEARRMRCNTRLMNSWHSFSPNGRWLVFSTKANRPYTQMMLTHIDDEGQDSPAILIENSTADNRAVNLPEFINVDYNEFLGISVPAVDFYRHFRRGNELSAEGRLEEALAEYTQGLEESNESRIHDAMARDLMLLGQNDKALKHLRQSLKLHPYNFVTHTNMGYLLEERGEYPRALEHLNWAVRIHPRHAQAWFNRAALQLKLGHADLALADYTEALRRQPRFPRALNGRGIVLLEMGQRTRALADFEESVEINPEDPTGWYFKALIRQQLGDLSGALLDVDQALAVAKPDFPQYELIRTLQAEIRSKLDGTQDAS